MEITFGAKVWSADGKDVGAVGQMVVDSNTKSINAFILRGGQSNQDDIIVPIEMAQRCDADDTIHLSCSAEQLMTFTDFEQDQFVVLEHVERKEWQYLTPTTAAGVIVPAASFGGSVGGGIHGYDPGDDSFLGIEDPTDQEIATWTNLPEWFYRVSKGTKIVTRDDHTVGALRAVDIGEDGKPLGIAIMPGRFNHTAHYIPVAYIRSADAEQVLLNLTRDEYRAKEYEFTSHTT